MAVDIGAEFLKVSVVAPGRQPISIAINEMSRRKTPVLAGFVDGQRVLGEDAVTLSARHPDKFVRRLRDLIGRPADDPTVQAVLEQSALNYDVVPDARRGSLRVRLPGFERPFTIEELVASELVYAKGIAEAHTGAAISDAVLLVPPHFGPAQRQALMDAVQLSGLTLLSLMNTHAAAALQYGIERDFTGKSEDVIVYDVSSTDVVAALVRFSAFPVKGSTKQQSQFQVLDVAWRERVGASFLDTLLLKHFAKQFVEQHGTEDVLQYPKVVAKMAKPVRRTKEMLSANTEAPFMVEELYMGIDFSSSISRKEFESIAGSYWEEVKAPLQELLDRNNITSAANITMQMIGGGSRIPRVQADLAKVLEGLSLEKQLDADEAPAMGAGLMAANMSTTFRLRQFGMQDGITYPIAISLEPGKGIPDTHNEFFPKNGGQVLAPFMKKLGTKRKVTLPGITADTFKFTLFYSGDRKPCCLKTDKIATYEVSGLAAVTERYGEPGKVALHFEVDNNGMLTFIQADSTVSIEETIQVDKMVPDEDAAAAATANATVNATANATEGAEEAAANSTAKNSTKAPKMKKIKVPQQVMRPRVVTLDIKTELFGLLTMNEEEKTESKALLEKFFQLEQEKKMLEMSKNSLESYIINTRSILTDESVQTVTTEFQRQEFREALDAMEEWLYEDEASAANADTMYEKMLELQKMGEPIKGRVDELARRPARVAAAIELTEIVAKATNSWPENKPWLNSTHVEDLQQRSLEFRKWVDEVKEKQDSTPLFENPVFSVSELQDRFEVVSKIFTKLNTTPAPKPPPEPKPKAEPEKASADAADPESQADAQPSDSSASDDSTDSSEPAHEEL